jgi:hypothetical protein
VAVSKLNPPGGDVEANYRNGRIERINYELQIMNYEF